MIRNVLLSGVSGSIDSSIGGVDNGAFIMAVKDTFNFNASAYGFSFSGVTSVLYVCAIALACVAIMTIVYNKTYRRG